MKVSIILEKDKLENIINGCLKGKPKSQEQLYQHFYGYAMSICLRYANNEADAVEILNDGFLKVFTNINKHDSAQSFKAWLRRIIINTAIDHYRKTKTKLTTYELDESVENSSSVTTDLEIDKEEILLMVQQLPPAYNMVFNLYVIEGFAHKEIAQMLKITESTSRSHLTTANAKLREMLKKKTRILVRHGR